jgi:phage FluMu protein Com
MPIDFRCARCGKLLRVGDESAGKKSRCPDCGNIQDIPTSASPACAAVFST